MLTIALCDDHPEDVLLVRAALDSYLSRMRKEPVQIRTFTNALLCAESLERSEGADIVLLDICMPGLFGTDIARELRQRNNSAEIIFLTTSDEFAVEAFALKAAHYLIKPFSQSEFDEALSVALERCSNHKGKRITLKGRGGTIVSLDVEEITYVENSLHSQHIYTTTSERIEARQTLSEVFSILEKARPGQFFIPYKGYIVNINAIRLIEKARVTLRNGTSIPVTSANAKVLKERYFDYVFPYERTQWKP